MTEISCIHFNICLKARGSVGTIGGKYSEEFVLGSDLGEDEVFKCNSCDKAFNAELIATRQEVECMFCSSHDLTKFNAIEVGHTFLLGNRYSEKFDAKYTANETKAKK
jgi:prolyl-tRNA synthetase